MEAELDFPGQLIPREFQPSGQSYIKYSETEGKFMKSKTIASIFLFLSPSFSDCFKVINESSIYEGIEA
ncbi:hypothetical protein [Staphylococcus delphini]|uniref:Uncharacterized protein n=1 Tax=Staphylococcus delphini TaxID=53344 RepID=A0AAQ0D8A0_9STAP|nr:hypothetical protein [Staphylococcus delphini]QUM67435.1 hypothetical protein IPU21_02725 [Staphylococcus delphini]QUM69880.1 hypothetical protein IPU22_02715 [Staphylococcus delphini]HEC2172445.1 hypothetical protein [Staphylococcus delphini]